jgi:hypothetical protein
LSVDPVKDSPVPRVTFVNPPDPEPARSWEVVAVVAGAKEEDAWVAAVPRPRFVLAEETELRSARLLVATRYDPAGCLLLKVFQSVDERYPLLPAEAWVIPITPEAMVIGGLDEIDEAGPANVQ